MNKLRITLAAIFSITIGLEAMAGCRLVTVTPCVGCMTQTQTICEMDPLPEPPAMPMRNNMEDFYRGAAQFNQGVRDFSNSR